jgi:hypothetical protein
MPAVVLVPADLAPFAVIDSVKAQAMIDDAMARAARFAPCILTPDFAYEGAALAILRGAILRWNDAGSGAYTSKQETAGPFSLSQGIDSQPPRRSLFWPSEITELQDLCKGPEVSGAYSVDTVGTTFGYYGYPSTVMAGFDDPAYPGFDSTPYEPSNH